MTGTFINAGAILVGSIIGISIHSRLPERFTKIVFQSIGLFTLFLGVYMGLKTNSFFLIIISLVIGGILGELLHLDIKINQMGDFLKSRFKSENSKFSEGLVTSFLLFCMGSVTILGAIEEGLGGKPNLLLAKSVLDGASSIALAAAFGFGVAFSIIPLLIYQGGITLLAVYFGNFFSEPIINELTSVGGIILIGLGINILEIKQLKIINLLPSLVIIIILAYFFI